MPDNKTFRLFAFGGVDASERSFRMLFCMLFGTSTIVESITEIFLVVRLLGKVYELGIHDRMNMKICTAAEITAGK